MDWLVNPRAHSLDLVFTMVFTPSCGLVPVYLLGFVQATAVSVDLILLIFMIFDHLWSFVTHSNVNLRLGFLGRIIASPAPHHWHYIHQYPRLTDKNSAAILPFYGMILDLFCLSRKLVRTLGLVVSSNAVPHQRKCLPLFL